MNSKEKQSAWSQNKNKSEWNMCKRQTDSKTVHAKV